MEHHKPLSTMTVEELPFRYDDQRRRVCSALGELTVASLLTTYPTPEDLLRPRGLGHASRHALVRALEQLGIVFEGTRWVTSESELRWPESLVAGLHTESEQALVDAEARLRTRLPHARYTAMVDGAPWTMNAWLVVTDDGAWSIIRGDTYGILAYRVDSHTDEAAARADLHRDRAVGPSSEEIAVLYRTSPAQIDLVLADLRPLFDTDEDFTIWRASDGALDTCLGPYGHRLRRPRHELVACFFMTDVVDDAGLRYCLSSESIVSLPHDLVILARSSSP